MRTADVTRDPISRPDPLAMARAFQRLLACGSLDDLRDVVADTLNNALRRVRRFELFTTDAQGGLLPNVRLGSGEFGSGLKLLHALVPASNSTPTSGRYAAAQFRESRLVPAARGVQRGSLLAAPLLDGEIVRGLVVVESPVEVSYAPLDLELLEGLAALYCLAVARLSARDEEVVHGQIARDLAQAARVQRGLLPGVPPEAARLLVDYRYLPAHVIGGDFYDVVVADDGTVTAIVGDVCGKGISGALIMARLVPEVRRVLLGGGMPAAVLGELNRIVGATVAAEGAFVTATCLRIEPAKGVRRRLVAATAGGVPPLLRRQAGEPEAFAQPSGTPLGMLDDERYSDEALLAALGDTVVLMTDGLIEALDRPSDRLGMSLLLGLLEYAPSDPKHLNDRLLTAVGKMKGTRQLDDVTMVTLHLL